MRVRYVALIILSILMSGLSAHALGGKEDPLIEADRLIAAQEYDQAILYLADFMKQYPERFEEGQKKLQKIAKLRAEWNEKALELFRPGISDDEIKAIIEDMTGIEDPSNETMRDFIAKTYEYAEFTTNRDTFESIMARGRELINQGSYAQAMNLYASGFTLYRQRFLDSGVSQELIDSSIATTEEVNTAIAYYAEVGSRLRDASRALAAAYEDYARAPASREAAAGQALAAAMETERLAAAEHAKVRRLVVDAGRALEANFAQFKSEQATATDNSYLPFASRLVLGRSSETLPEGVAGAMDADWDQALKRARDAVDRALTDALAAARLAYTGGQWQEAGTAFDKAAALAERAVPMQALWAHYVPSDLAQRQTNFGTAKLAEQGAFYLSYLHAADSARAWSALAGLRLDLSQEAGLAESYQPADSRTEGLDGFVRRRTAILALIQEASDLQTASGDRAQELARFVNLGYGLSAAMELQGALDGSVQAGIDQARTDETSLVGKQAAWEYGLMAADLEGTATLVAEGTTLLQGLPSEDPNLPDAVLKYPGKALASFTKVDGDLKALSKRLTDYLAAYRALPAYLASSVSVLEWVEKAASLSQALAERTAENAGLLARASEQKRLADLAANEAQRRVDEARSALRAANFETARERLDRASERYVASLGYEENPELRASSDTLLAELGAAIVKAQNDLVIAETSRLRTEGKSLYLQGQFARAESSLLQARSTWSRTNDKPETEVEYWLKLVQTALQVESGRDIPVTAPLYPEMSLLLSQAKSLFEEGAAFMSSRDTRSALEVLGQAREKIAEVKVMFPLNQAARVLDLRIDQLVDSDQFNRKFADMVTEARRKVDARQDLATVYSDLKDLYEINPRYSGLRELIERVEILIGIRLPPPDPKAVAEARQLTQAAQAIYDSGDRSRFPTALAQLERALVLDPNNETASRLKDRILLYTGGTQTIVLPAAAEALYAEAESAFSRADYIGARARLSRLLSAYAQASRVQKVVELDNRLKALGY